MAGLAGVLAAHFPLRRWYAARFGILTQPITASAVVPIVAVIACLPIALALQEKARLPFSLPTLLVGVVLAPVGIAHYPLRRHYLAAAALFVGLAFLGTLGVTPSVRRMLFDAAIGVALAIVGIGDHQLLTATLEEVHAYV